MPDPLHQRLWDLVRQQRMELFQADLITHEEYAELAKDHPAVARLETYDGIRARLKTAEAERDELQRLLSEERKVAGETIAECAMEAAELQRKLDDLKRVLRSLAAPVREGEGGTE